MEKINHERIFEIEHRSPAWGKIATVAIFVIVALGVAGWVDGGNQKIEPEAKNFTRPPWTENVPIFKTEKGGEKSYFPPCDGFRDPDGVCHMPGKAQNGPSPIDDWKNQDRAAGLNWMDKSKQGEKHCTGDRACLRHLQ